LSLVNFTDLSPQPYIALSKSANSPRAAADLVVKATSDPNTTVFAELLETPNIQKLAQNEEYKGFLTLLQIFSWGSYGDYTGELSTNQSLHSKLRKWMMVKELFAKPCPQPPQVYHH
jgi:COP9 signalosome complex subunit 7